jgi:hypothetical protein
MKWEVFFLANPEIGSDSETNSYEPCNNSRINPQEFRATYREKVLLIIFILINF